MAWYGPSGDCGCQCGPVPPPDCICEDFALLGEADQFLSVKVEIEFFQDTWEFEEIIRSNFTCAPLDPCRNKQITRTITKRYENLQSINGTYDIGYYQVVDGEFIEATVGDTPCGFWFFPIIEWEIDQFEETTFEVEDDCEIIPSMESNNLRTIQVPLIDCRWIGAEGLTINPGSTVDASTLPEATFRFERTAFPDYDPLGIGDTFNEVDIQLDVSIELGGILGFANETTGFRPTLRMPVFPGWGVSLGKTVAGQETVTINGVTGHMRPLFRPYCMAGAQQVSAELQAYSFNRENSPSNCEGTPDPPQILSTYDISFGALKWRVRLILEV